MNVSLADIVIAYGAVFPDQKMDPHTPYDAHAANIMGAHPGSYRLIFEACARERARAGAPVGGGWEVLSPIVRKELIAAGVLA